MKKKKKKALGTDPLRASQAQAVADDGIEDDDLLPPDEDEEQDEAEAEAEAEAEDDASAQEADEDVETDAEEEPSAAAAAVEEEPSEVVEPAVDAGELISQLEKELTEPEPESPVAAQLRLIAEAGEVTVDDYRRLLELPQWGANQANQLLQQLVSHGLVERTWRNSAGRYSLTAAGRAEAGV